MKRIPCFPPLHLSTPPLPQRFIHTRTIVAGETPPTPPDTETEEAMNTLQRLGHASVAQSMAKVLTPTPTKPYKDA
jgi:hypothetical protein